MGTIAHFGTFDVANLGDLLLPAILEQRLAGLGHTFLHVAPLGGLPVWADCVATISTDAFIATPPADLAAVIIGGGPYLDAGPTPLARYDQSGLSALLASPALWLGSAALAAQRNVPYCWNAPGVPQPFTPAGARLAAWAAASARYLAVHDHPSRISLREVGVASPLPVVPHTALDAARRWTSAELDEAFAEAFTNRGRAVPARVVALHIDSRGVSEPAASLAARLDRIAHQFQATPILLALDAGHGDGQAAREVGAQMAVAPLVVDRPRSLREVVACVARAEAWLGSALAGMVAACAFGVPAMGVVAPDAAEMRAWRGFLEPLQLSAWLAPTWESAEQRLDAFLAAPREPWARVPAATAPLLDEHWQALRQALAPQPAAGHGSPLAEARAGALAHPEPLPEAGDLLARLYAPLIAEHAAHALQDRRRADAAQAELRRLRADLAQRDAQLAAELAAARDTAAQERQLHAQRLSEQANRALDREDALANDLGAAARRAALIAIVLERARGRAARKGKMSKAADDLTIAQEELTRLRGQLDALLHAAPAPRPPHASDAALAAVWPGHGHPAEPPSAHAAHPAGWRPASAGPGHPPNGRVSAVELAAAVDPVEIIICVHDALEDVQRCLPAVVRHTPAPHRLIIVDDGSAPETAAYLQRFTRACPQATLVRNDHPAGYTRAANQGLRAATSDVVVLLNSDTIVTPQWLDHLLACLQSDPRLGIAGPLSNAASYQSVPERFDPGGDWALNPLPPGWDTDSLAAAVAELSARAFPRVPFVNGFCFAIKRAVIDAIGHFDEEAFPQGYGEENDYCLRAADAGFELAIADQAYVYHAKSRSYSHRRRRALGRAGRAALSARYGLARLEAGEAALRDDPHLAAMRAALATRLQAAQPRSQPGDLSVLFLLPVSGGGGGAHSVVQEASGMRRLGINAQVAIRAQHRARYRESYPDLAGGEQLFLTFRTEDELRAHAARFEVVVATIYTSIPLLAAITASQPGIVPAYYIQDYEPFFYPEGSPGRAEAARSYGLIPHAVLFAKTRWLCETVAALHDVAVHKVSPSLDHAVYYPSAAPRHGGPVRVAAMIRPSSPRRAAARTMDVLRRLAGELGQRVAVHIFGASDLDLAAAGLPRDFAFTNHGVLTREAVAAALRESDIFLDLSDYQAFGRTGLEAMACGCAVVLPALGGASEYARHGENALLVDTSDGDLCYQAAHALIVHPDARQRLQAAGLATAAGYSIDQAAQSELDVFTCARQAHGQVAHQARSVAARAG